MSSPTDLDQGSKILPMICGRYTLCPRRSPPHPTLSAPMGRGRRRDMGILQRHPSTRRGRGGQIPPASPDGREQQQNVSRRSDRKAPSLTKRDRAGHTAPRPCATNPCRPFHPEGSRPRAPQPPTFPPGALAGPGRGYRARRRGGQLAAQILGCGGSPGETLMTALGERHSAAVGAARTKQTRAKSDAEVIYILAAQDVHVRPVLLQHMMVILPDIRRSHSKARLPR